MHRTARTAIVGIRASFPILDPTAIQIEDGFISPSRIACFSRVGVPIGSMAARPGRYVHAGAAAQHLAHGVGDCASVQLRIARRDKTPIQFAADGPDPKGGVHDQFEFVAFSSFEQQHLHIWVGGKSSGDHRTGCSSAAHDKVEVSVKVFGERLLFWRDRHFGLRPVAIVVQYCLAHRELQNLFVCSASG